MWEYWRHKLAKDQPGGARTKDGSPRSAHAEEAAAAAARHVTFEDQANLPADEAHLADQSLPVSEPSKHIYFKDLKLLANEDELTEEDYDSSEASQSSRSSGDLAALDDLSLRSGETGHSDEAARHSGSSRQPSGVLSRQMSRQFSTKSDGRRRKAKRVDRQRLIVILVGLPARGKTFLCNKLMCYLNWLGHPTRHFNVGKYRRKQRAQDEVQTAAFFDIKNPAGQEARQRALVAALDDMEAWLETENAQVAIVDATNTTAERRNFLRSRFHGKWQYIFIESICNDPEVLEQNYRLKLLYSPDYRDTDPKQAMRDFMEHMRDRRGQTAVWRAGASLVSNQAELERGRQAASLLTVCCPAQDFKERIRHYEEVYETITDRSIHYIKLIDMVTGRGYMDVNRISGYIPGKMVFFLMQVCRAGTGRPRRIWLTRHGESQYNVLGKIGGNSALSPRGEMYASLLPDILTDRVPTTVDGTPLPVAAWTSTLNRTIQTAAGLPFPKLQWKALDEIQAGMCDGMTYEEIYERMPEEYARRKKEKLHYRYPSGESYMDVIQRLEPVVTEVERERECVVIVAHQAVLRALYGYFMNKPLDEVPRIEIPLHTVMELIPRADGTMAETRFKVNVDKALEQERRAAGISGTSTPEGPPLADMPHAASSSMPIPHTSSFGSLSGRLSGGGGMRRSISIAELANQQLLEEEEILGFKPNRPGFVVGSP